MKVIFKLKIYHGNSIKTICIWVYQIKWKMQLQMLLETETDFKSNRRSYFENK